MLNLFAFRATSPSDMFNADSPIGDENDKYIQMYSKLSDKVICAWDNDGNFKNRSQYILSNIENKFYLKLNKSGEPAHPLYLSKDLIPIRF